MLKHLLRQAGGKDHACKGSLCFEEDSHGHIRKWKWKTLTLTTKRQDNSTIGNIREAVREEISSKKSHNHSPGGEDSFLFLHVEPGARFERHVRGMKSLSGQCKIRATITLHLLVSAMMKQTAPRRLEDEESAKQPDVD